MAPKSDIFLWMDRYYRTVRYIERQYTYYEKHLQWIRRQRTFETIAKIVLPVLASGLVEKFFASSSALVLPFFTLSVQVVIAFVSSQSIDKAEALIELFLSSAGELRQKASGQFLIDLSRRDSLTAEYIAQTIADLRTEFNNLDLQILGGAGIVYKDKIVAKAHEEADCYLTGLLTEEVSDFEKYGEESDASGENTNIRPST